MTVERTTVSSGPFIANGVTTSFPFDFHAASDAEVSVEIDGVPVSPSEFSVYVNPDGTGAVNFLSAPAPGQVFIYSSPLFTQEVAFEDQGPFYQASVNEPIDRSAIRDLWLKSRVELLTTTAFLNPANRAGRYLSWDAFGDPYFTTGTGADSALRSELAEEDGVLKVGSATPVRSTVAKLAALNPLAGVAQLNTDLRRGSFYWLTGDQSARVASDPLQGIYIAPSSAPTGASGCWARIWDGIRGKLEWFGAMAYPTFEDWSALTTAQRNARLAQAAINDTAFQYARNLFPITELGEGRYYTSQMVRWNMSDRILVGAGSGYGGNRASIICLIGSAASSSTVFQFGADTSVSAAVRGVFATDVAFWRVGTVPNGSASGHAEDCVKGVVCQYVTNSEMRRTRVYGSPVGYHITYTGNFVFSANNHEPTASATSDIIVSFLMGGYSVYNTYVGNNGSLSMEGNNAFFPVGVTSNYASAFLLYGYIADTWFERCEGAGGKFGLDITALTKAAAITYFAGGGSGGSAVVPDANSGNDITVHNCRMDGSSVVGFYFHNLNNSTSINFINPYAAGSTQQIALNQIDGRVSLLAGELIPNAAGQRGIDANNVALLSIDDVLIRDMVAPVTIASCGGVKLDPIIYNPTIAATGPAISLTNVSRSRISGTIRGGSAKFTIGVDLVGTTCGFNSIDGSGYDYGSFVTASAAQKVRYNSGDARSAAGTNVLVGVTG